MDVKGHHQQEEQICDGQVQHVNVRNHLLLARGHSIDNQTVGQRSHRTQDAVDGGKDVHERRDVNHAVRRDSSVYARVVGRVGNFWVAKIARGVHGERLQSICVKKKYEKQRQEKFEINYASFYAQQHRAISKPIKVVNAFLSMSVAFSSRLWVNLASKYCLKTQVSKRSSWTLCVCLLQYRSWTDSSCLHPSLTLPFTPNQYPQEKWYHNSLCFNDNYV